jgi:hypothetical protein
MNRSPAITQQDRSRRFVERHSGSHRRSSVAGGDWHGLLVFFCGCNPICKVFVLVRPVPAVLLPIKVTHRGGEADRAAGAMLEVG